MVSISVRLSDELKAAIEEKAEKFKIKKSEVVREMISRSLYK